MFSVRLDFFAPSQCNFPKFSAIGFN